MNTQSILRTGTVLALSAVFGACSDLTDLNVNPNEPVDVGADYLLPSAIVSAVDRTNGAYLNLDLVGLWVQHYAEHQYTIEDVYEVGDGTVSGHWSNFYAGPLRNLEEVIQQGRDLDRPNLTAVGSILDAWLIQVVTDLWGDVGWSQALLGRDSRSDMTVPYDTQESVYDAILETLATAAGSFDADGAKIVQGDLIYGGDLTRWRRFANSLRLRAAMRLSGVAPDLARAQFADALADGVFTSNADNAVLQYLDNGVDVGPIYAYQRTRNDHSISKTLVDTLKALADPRLPIYAKPNAAGEYTGTPNGSMTNPQLATVSQVGTYFSKADAQSVIQAYSEVLFLQAEAAERGWIAGSAAALYEEGITAAMSQIGVSDADIAAYLAQPRVQYAGGQAGLDQIWLQKWISLFGNGPEAYAEWRRTGVPGLQAGPDALNDGRIPLRLEYPEREHTLNRAEVEAAIARQGGATLNDPVWWDTGG